MAESGSGEVVTGVNLDRSDRSGSVARVLVLALAMVAAAIAIPLLAKEMAGPLILGLLVLLAVIGVFSLFCGAVGILRFGTRESSDGGLTRHIVDESSDGTVVADRNGRVIYANAAYLKLTGATGERDVRPVQRAFSGDPDVSEAVYRLAEAARSEQRLVEEFRVSAAPGGGGAAWFRVRVRPGRPGETICSSPTLPIAGESRCPSPASPAVPSGSTR
jgi:two-component system cell cycle sensor histidine kinase/response regulator CckA